MHKIIEKNTILINVLRCIHINPFVLIFGSFFLSSREPIHIFICINNAVRELKELNWMFSVSRSVVKLVNGILSERMLWIFFSSFRVLLCMYRYYYDYNIALFALNRRRQRINARKLQKGSMALVIQQYLVTKTGSEEEMTTHNVGLSFEKPREKNFFFLK